MKISACYIVRNEAANISKSIASLYDQVDEIVVVDTGSTDRTKDIIRSYAKAILLEQVWQNDFALARNTALEAATGDWIVFLDADEYFSEATRGNLRQIIGKYAGQQALAVKIINVESERVDGQVVGIDAPFVLRAFRHDPSICYTRRIHEYLQQAGMPLSKIQFIPLADLCIMHTGYTVDRLPDKASRNLDLLLQELKTTSQPEELYRYLAEAYDGLGEKEKAIYYARLDIADGPKPMAYASRCYRLLMNCLQDKEERAAIIRQAMHDFPAIPEFYAEYAEYLAVSLRYAEAVDYMKRAFQAYEQYQEDGESMQFTEERYALAEKRIALWRRIISRIKKLKISACVIARNEEQNIGNWLENAKLYADELILVDTGSTDATSEIAKSHGAKVERLPWQDDFSAPRNRAVALADGEWIVFLDADETFYHPEEVRSYLAMLDVCQPQQEAVMLIVVNVDEDKADQELQRFPTIRIFKNKEALFYAGRVHESLHKQAGAIATQLVTDYLLVRHTGYSSKRVLAKLHRNFALLQKDIKENGEGPQHYRYLSDCYYGFKDYHKALYYALMALDSEAASIGCDSDMYQQALECMRKCKMSLEDMLALAERAIKEYPQLPDFYAQKGMILCGQNKLKVACQVLERAVAYYEHPADRSNATAFRAYAVPVYQRLGRLYHVFHQDNEERNVLLKALQINPYCYETLNAYYATFFNDEKFMVAVTEVLPVSQKNIMFLQQWAAMEGKIKLSADFCQRLQREYKVAGFLGDFYKLWQQGEWTQLEKKIQQRYVTEMQQLAVALLMSTEMDIDRSELLKSVQSIQLPSMQRILERYMESTMKLTAEEWESYLLLLPVVVRQCVSQQAERYCQLVQDFSAAQRCQAAQALMTEQQWKLAVGVYETIEAEDEAVDVDFWHSLGICFYHLQQFSVARECFDKAETMGYTGKDLQAYRAWIAERMA